MPITTIHTSHKVTLPIAVTKENIKEAAPVLLLSHNWAVGCCTHTGLQSWDQCFEVELISIYMFVHYSKEIRGLRPLRCLDYPTFIFSPVCALRKDLSPPPPNSPASSFAISAAPVDFKCVFNQSSDADVADDADVCFQLFSYFSQLLPSALSAGHALWKDR